VAGVGQSLIFWPPERLPAEEKTKKLRPSAPPENRPAEGFFRESMTFCSEEKVFLKKCLTILPYLV
jgi:hypothetical protein